MLPIQFKNFYTLNIVDLGYYNPDDPLLGLVHCPGLISMKTDKLIFMGVIIKEEHGNSLLGANEYYEITGSDWDYKLDNQCAFLNRSEYLFDQSLPKEHKKYFRSLLLYSRLLPNDTLVNKLLGIYQDGGLLTHTQRASIDTQLFLGSDSGGLVCNFEYLRCLDILAALGSQPGLDQSWVREMIDLCRTEETVYNDELNRRICANLQRFSHLIKPLSAKLVSVWPPEDRVLSLDWE